MKSKKNVIKLIIFIVIILLFGIIGTLYEKNISVKTYVDKYIFHKEKYENNLPNILIETNNDANIYAYNGNIISLKNNTLTVYNEFGNEEYTLDIEISNPIFSTSGNYLAVGEKQGTNVYVINGKNIVWHENLEGQISNLKINSEGYLMVVTTGTIYKNIIQTFNNKGKELFRNFIQSTYIVDMDISPDSKYIAIAEVNSSGILVQSYIKIISIEKAASGEQDAFTYKKEGKPGDLVVNIKYQSKDRLVVIYDNHIETIKDNNTNEINFSEEDVSFVDLNNKIIKILNRDSQVIMQIINNDLTSIKEYTIQEPKALYVSDSVIALNLGTEILFYNNSGWLIKKYYANQEVNKIVLCGDLAGIVYNDKIELISL